MGWVLRLVENETDNPPRSVDVLTIERPGDLSDLAALGLTQAEGKQQPLSSDRDSAACCGLLAGRAASGRICARPAVRSGGWVSPASLVAGDL